MCSGLFPVSAITGHTVHIDKNGDREMNMTLLDLQPSDRGFAKDCQNLGKDKIPFPVSSTMENYSTALNLDDP